MSRLPDNEAPTAKPGREQACGRALLVIQKAEVGRLTNLVVEVEKTHPLDADQSRCQAVRMTDVMKPSTGAR
jgi:hypothetical protein